MAPPKVPSGRLDALRNALAKVVKDEEFVRDAEKRKLQIDPLSGPEVQKIVADVVGAPDAVVQKMREVIKPPKQ
jgi:tripartite-type tricarboxylate transporter receptor subunit TctC